jgi:hypothetical protein
LFCFVLNHVEISQTISHQLCFWYCWKNFWLCLLYYKKLAFNRPSMMRHAWRWFRNVYICNFEYLHKRKFNRVQNLNLNNWGRVQMIMDALIFTFPYFVTCSWNLSRLKYLSYQFSISCTPPVLTPFKLCFNLNFTYVSWQLNEMHRRNEHLFSR